MRPSGDVQQMCNCSCRAANAAQQVDSSYGRLSDDQLCFHSVVSCRNRSCLGTEESAQKILFLSKFSIVFFSYYWTWKVLGVLVVVFMRNHTTTKTPVIGYEVLSFSGGIHNFPTRYPTGSWFTLPKSETVGQNSCLKQEKIRTCFKIMTLNIRNWQLLKKIKD